MKQTGGSDLTILVGKEAGTGKIWMTQKLGQRKDPPTYLTLANLSIMALEFEAAGEMEAAAFVRDVVDRIERSAVLEAIEESYLFPSVDS